MFQTTRSFPSSKATGSAAISGKPRNAYSTRRSKKYSAARATWFGMKSLRAKRPKANFDNWLPDDTSTPSANFASPSKARSLRPWEAAFAR